MRKSISRSLVVWLYFPFVNQSFTGIFTALGNSKAAFLATTSGLIVNIILDPVLYSRSRTISGYADHGCCCRNRNRPGDCNPDISYIYKERYSDFPGSTFLGKPNMHYLTSIIKIGFPTSIQSMLFTGISMIIARLVAGYGDAAVAVPEKVGSQIRIHFLDDG